MTENSIKHTCIRLRKISDRTVPVISAMQPYWDEQMRKSKKEFQDVAAVLGEYAAKYLFNHSDAHIRGEMLDHVSMWSMEICAKVPRDLVAPIAFCIPEYSAQAVQDYVENWDMSSKARFEKLFAQDDFLNTNLTFLVSACKSSTNSNLSARTPLDCAYVDPFAVRYPSRMEDEAQMLAAANAISHIWVQTPNETFKHELAPKKEQQLKMLEELGDAQASVVVHKTKDGLLVEFQFNSLFSAGYNHQHLYDHRLVLRPLPVVSFEELAAAGLTEEMFGRHWSDLFAFISQGGSLARLDISDANASIPVEPLVFKN